MLFARSRDLVGLDIGDSAVKLAELKDLGRGRGYQLTTLAAEPLSGEAIVDGAIMDSGLVIETIQRLFRNHKVRTKQVATSLSGHSVIIKRVSLPVMNAQQLTALMDIGAAVTSIVVLQGGNPSFWRDINIGGNQYTDAVQKELNLSAEDSERIKKGEEVSGAPADSVIPILAAVTEDVCSE